jgi:aryl-alcohol dehydrogenase-like predicted oxidoreductase
LKYRQLGRTDLQVSSIGLGCVTFGREIDQQTACAVMDHALERGINLFDTAEAYAAGRSEEVIGQWLADRQTRDKVVLATKVAGAQTREHILASAEDSLRRLQTNHIDLFKVHNWDAETPLEETLAALNILVEQGKVRYIGCSNYDADQLAQALKETATLGGARMEATQPNYNLVVRDIEESLLPLCTEQQIGIVSYSPLGAGFLTGKYRREGPLPEGTRFEVMPGHQDIYFKDAYFSVVEGLRAKAATLDRSMVDLALAWVIGQPGITSVLVGARDTAQIDQAFAAEATGLDDELRAELSSL